MTATDTDPQASLPMYDFAPLRAATDAWWAGIAQALAPRLDAVTTRLVRDAGAHALWRSDALLLSQCCGYPLTHGFEDCLRVVATPIYDAPGCVGPCYASAIVVRADSATRLEGARLAFNARDSMSGYAVWQTLLDAPVEDVFAACVASGSHRDSLAAVRASRADVTAVDCVSLALLRDVEPDALAGLRVARFSMPSMGLPLVTRAGAGERTVTALRDALFAAANEPALAPVRRKLRIKGVAASDVEDYRAIAALA